MHARLRERPGFGVMKRKASISRPGRKLNAMYRALENAYGPQGWWPAESRFEVIVGAILAQNTSWENVTRALKNLDRANGLSIRGMERMTVGRLAGQVKPAGYYRQKARKLKEFLSFLDREYHGDLDSMFAEQTAVLREQLLGIWGIGPETADSILLYAGSRPVFVVDAYTLRIFRCQGLITEKAEYHEVQKMVTQYMGVNAQAFNEFHALLVKLGKTHCRKTPRCEGCPLVRGRSRKRVD